MRGGWSLTARPSIRLENAVLVIRITAPEEGPLQTAFKILTGISPLVAIAIAVLSIVQVQKLNACNVTRDERKDLILTLHRISPFFDRSYIDGPPRLSAAGGLSHDIPSLRDRVHAGMVNIIGAYRELTTSTITWDEDGFTLLYDLRNRLPFLLDEQSNTLTSGDYIEFLSTINSALTNAEYHLRSVQATLDGRIERHCRVSL